MDKKFFISWVVIFVVWMAGSFVIHVLLLGGSYAELPNLMRTQADQESHFHWLLLGHIIMAGAFVWIYARGKEDKPWLQQGIRFGIAIALLAIVPTYMIFYAVQPLPGMHVVQGIIYETVLLLILGIVVAFLNKPQAAAASE